MQRIAIVLALLEVVLAGIIPPSHFETKEAQMVNEQAQVAVNPIYMPALNNNPPPTRYSYPTYPDHSPAASHTVQSGYEGYSAPTALLPQKSNQWSPRNIISSLTPIVNSLVLYGTRTSIVLLQLLLVTFMGVGITSLVCTYTNFCNSFMGFKTDVKEQVTELARSYITPESLRMASLLVSQAIDKYGTENEEQQNVKTSAMMQEAPNNLTPQ